MEIRRIDQGKKDERGEKEKKERGEKEDRSRR